MKRIWLGGVALMMAIPSFGQSNEEPKRKQTLRKFKHTATNQAEQGDSPQELKRKLAERNAEVQHLRGRIGMLEQKLALLLDRELTSLKIKQAAITTPAAPEDGLQDSTRALERALVRENGLLLPLGQYEAELNFAFSHSADNASAFRRNAYGPGLVFRAGWPWRAQLEISVPYVFERRRSGTAESRSSGMGDFTLGLSRQLLNESASKPGVIGSFNYHASTGENTLFESASPVALGSGFDAAQIGFNAIKRVDPLVFFGSYGFTHSFSENKSGIRVNPGNSHSVGFGTALAASPYTSLRAALNLTFFREAKVNGSAIPGSDEHAAELHMGSSVVLNQSTALDVLVGAGLTNNAPKYRVSFAVPIRF